MRYLILLIILIIACQRSVREIPFWPKQNVTYKLLRCSGYEHIYGIDILGVEKKVGNIKHTYYFFDNDGEVATSQTWTILDDNPIDSIKELSRALHDNGFIPCAELDLEKNNFVSSHRYKGLYRAAVGSLGNLIITYDFVFENPNYGEEQLLPDEWEKYSNE